MTYPEGLNVALCYGWINALKKPESESAWLQRFVPRRKSSLWSKINREKAMGLIERGEMRPRGLAEVERAKGDGRWDAAYDSQSSATVPAELEAALEKNPRASDFFANLDRVNRYAIIWRIQTAKRARDPGASRRYSRRDAGERREAALDNCHSRRSHMIIRIKKNPDGRTSLSCTRPDGTTTWQRLEGTQAKFFPRHDLTHYAVETVLAGNRVSTPSSPPAGISRTSATPWPRGRIPPEATFSEMIVGLLDLERQHRAFGDRRGRQHAAWTNSAASTIFPRAEPISDTDLDRIRQRRAELFGQWESVNPGDALELPFPT